MTHAAISKSPQLFVVQLPLSVWRCAWLTRVHVRVRTGLWVSAVALVHPVGHQQGQVGQHQVGA